MARVAKSSKLGSTDSRFVALNGSREQARDAFAALVKRELGPALGADMLRRLRVDRMIIIPAPRGVIAHASFKPRRPLTRANLRRHAPIVGVQVNTVPLIDPVTGTALEPGVYAVRLRCVGGDRFAFDYHRRQGPPHFSTLAQTSAQEIGEPQDTLDADIIFPPGDDPNTLIPPGDPGYCCLSLFGWSKCWRWDWPEWPKWPWPFNGL
jgi:hypothetical protein